MVPIPNRRGRHDAAPFGLGSWDGARVASQQSPTPRPGQRYCTRPEGAVEPDRTERSWRDHAAARLFDPSGPCGYSRSLPFGPTRDVSWMRRPGTLRTQVSSTMLWLEWPGRGGIRTRQVRVRRGRGPGGAAHGYRGRYLAKECVGSNRAVKRTIATSRSEATTTGTVPDNETKGRAQESLPPNEPEENATCAPALPLPSQPEENRFCLTNSFRNGHIDRGIRQHSHCHATQPRRWCRSPSVTLGP